MLRGNTCCSRGLRFKTITQGFCGSPNGGQVSITQEEKRNSREVKQCFGAASGHNLHPAAKFQQYFWKIKGENGASRHMVLHDTGLHWRGCWTNDGPLERILCSLFGRACHGERLGSRNLCKYEGEGTKSRNKHPFNLSCVCVRSTA